MWKSARGGYPPCMSMSVCHFPCILFYFVIFTCVAVLLFRDVQAVSVNRGLRMTSWFDVFSLRDMQKEDAEGIKKGARYGQSLSQKSLSWTHRWSSVSELVGPWMPEGLQAVMGRLFENVGCGSLPCTGGKLSKLRGFSKELTLFCIGVAHFWPHCSRFAEFVKLGSTLECLKFVEVSSQKSGHW